MDEGNTVLHLGAPVDSEKIFRMLFTRISLSVMEQNAVSGGSRNQWFLHGLSSYTGFIAEREMAGITDSAMVDDIMLKYYMYFVNAGKPLDLKLLTTPDEWKKSIGENPESTYAFASLATLYLIRSYGYEKAIAIFRMESEKSFDEAFKKVTGDQSKKFYKNLEKKFYPELKKLTESKT
jgi:hypothetical protein